MSQPNKFIVRQYTKEDIAPLIELQRACFPLPYPEEQLWNREQLLSHIQIFPQGALCVELENKIIASSTALIINWQPSDPSHSWAEIADNGYIGTHNPNGNSLYGIDMAVHPHWRKQGIAKLMYQARFALVQQLNLVRFLAAGRMSGYHNYQNIMTPEEYAQQIVHHKISDPALTPQLCAGLQPVQVLQDYIADEESNNCALLMEWRNPDYKANTHG